MRATLTRSYLFVSLTAFFWIAYTGRSGIFHYIAFSGMNVFNDQSLRAAKWRVTYYRNGELLPFMSPEGENLAWMDDENLKYRTYLGNAFQLEQKGLQSVLPSQLLRPHFYDHCAFGEADRTLEIWYAQEIHPRYRLKVEPSFMPTTCPSSLWFIFARLDSQPRSPLFVEPNESLKSFMTK